MVHSISSYMSTYATEFANSYSGLCNLSPSYLAQLEPLLADAISCACERYPRLGVPAEEFARYLASRLPPNVAPIDSLEALCSEDLYLACGCASGDARAISAFEQEHGALLDSVFRRIRTGQLTQDEYMQRLRVHLFVGEKPAIASYRGRGRVAAWLKVTATRRLLNWVDKSSDQDEVAATREQLLALVESTSDPSLALDLDRYRTEFSSAFEQSLSSLTSRQRNFLRHRYLQDMQVGDIANMYKLHRVTASRILAAALDTLFDTTRELFGEQLGLTASAADSVIRLVRSQLDVTLSQLLKT